MRLESVLMLALVVLPMLLLPAAFRFHWILASQALVAVALTLLGASILLWHLYTAPRRYALRCADCNAVFLGAAFGILLETGQCSVCGNEFERAAVGVDS
jgi:hypothetical protein